MNKYTVRFITRLLKVAAGLFIAALGTVLTINAEIGRSPWDVFYQGLSLKTGITIGEACNATAVAVLLICMLLKEFPSVGMICDTFVTGIFIDFWLSVHFLPKGASLLSGIIIMVIGFFVSAVGSSIYMKQTLGAGPKDTLMLAGVKHTRFPVGVIRISMESVACAAGWFMGGNVGIGTILSVFGLGIAIQVVFKLFRFDARSVRQENVKDTLRAIHKRDEPL